MAIPSFIISGTMYWAFLSKKDQYGKYAFDLVLDQDDTQPQAAQGNTPHSADQVKQQAPGFVKYDNLKYDGKPYIKLSSKEYPFRVLMDLDNSGEFKPVVPDQIPLVGNGSIARLKVTPYQTSFAGKKFNKLNVLVLQITKFIPYTKSDTDPLNQFYEFPKSTTSVGHSQDNATFTDELDDFL